MTTYNSLPVYGYTPQSEDKVEMVNENKLIEERLIRRCENLIDYIGKIKVRVNGNTEPSDSIGHPYDQRFLRMAISHFQEGFMCMNRAIFNPERVFLPEDTQ